jgi:hypothetical protein
MATNYLLQEEQIARAVKELKQQEFPNISATARKFDVPYQRLKRRFHGGHSKSTRPPTNRKLNSDQEYALKESIKRLDHIGVNLRVRDVATTANSILERNKQPLTATRHWAKNYLARNKDLHVVKQKPIEPARKETHSTIDPIFTGFEQLHEVVEKHGI